jgi:hypothetical protein
LKHGYWLSVGALLIMALGVFVLPENESTLPENPLPVAAAASSLSGSETNSPENSDYDLQTRMETCRPTGQGWKASPRLFKRIAKPSASIPTTRLVLNNLAWSLAANPRQELRNGREAVQLASKAVELTGQQQPVFMGTLAAAYAEDGQFAKAVEMAKKARDTALLTAPAGSGRDKRTIVKIILRRQSGRLDEWTIAEIARGSGTVCADGCRRLLRSSGLGT